MPTTLQKAYPELQEGGHNDTNSDNAPASRISVAWIGRFVDDDTRYDRFLCPPPATPSAACEEHRSTCAYQRRREPVSSPAARWPAP